MPFSASKYMELRQKRLTESSEENAHPSMIQQPAADTAPAVQPADNFTSEYKALRQKRLAEQQQTAQNAKAQRDKLYQEASQKGIAAYNSAKAAQQQEVADRSFWETLLINNANAYSYAAPDASIPVQAIKNVQRIYAEDTSYKEPSDTWSEADWAEFGYLYSFSPQKATEYAIEVNERINREKENHARQKAVDAATQSGWDMAGQAVAARATNLTAIADLMNKIAEFSVRGRVTSDGVLSPYEYGKAVDAGISQKLNETGGTLSEDIPIIGGKGWGDVYSVGTSIADSMIGAATGNKAFVTANSFAGAASTSMDDALSRGASTEEAALYGLLSGLAEAGTEYMEVDRLMNIGSADGLKGVFKNILKNAAPEAVEEGITSIIDEFADRLVMGDKSNYEIAVTQYQRQGMSYDQARRQAWADFANNTAFDMLAGFASGGISGGIQTGANSLIDRNSTTQQPQSAPTTAETESDISAPAAQQSKLDVTQLFDDAIAQATGAPADPISAAVESFKTGGTVTNKQAQDILNNTKAITQLLEQTGMKLPDTASGRRSAVKQAIAQLAQQPTETIDTTQNTDYDNKTTTGGTIYADAEQPGLSGTSETGLPGGAGAERLRGVGSRQISVSGQTPGGMETGSRMGSGGLEAESGSSGFEVQLRVSPVLRVSDNLAAAQQQSGVKTYPVRDTTAQPQIYANALIAGRNSDSANGWCVTPKSAQELQDEGVRTIMNDTGTVGVGIAQNGDIVAVFKNKNGGPPRALDTIMPIAIEQGGNRLDCYGEGLVRAYENYGFIPVARVEFNSEYANDGWTPDKGAPHIYFMVHNGDTSDQVASNIRKYPHATQEQLDALPTYGKDDYDAAMSYRDSLMDQRTAVRNVKDNSTVSVGAAPADFTGKSAYNDLLREGNVQPDRPGDVRPMEVPKTDSYGRHVSETAANLYGAEITPDETASRIEDLIAMGALGFDTKTNKQMVEEAAAAIKKKGVSDSREAVKTAAFNGKAKDIDIAKAALLYTTYANRKSNDAQDRAAEMAVVLATMANDAGRRLQLFKLLRKMTPQGQLMAVQKGVQRSVDHINEGRGKNNQAEVTIPQELVDEYLDAARRDIDEQTEETAQEKEEVEKTIYKVAAAQIKATPMEKLNAWRYMSMLGNAKTQVRNIFGNAAFRPMASVKRAVGAVIERFTVEQENRTKAILGTGQDAKALLSWAQNDAKSKDAQQLLSYSGLTGDAARDTIQDERQIFDTKWLETVRQTVQEVPEYFDMVFKSREYAYSLASFVKARGYTSADLMSGKVSEDTLNAARSYAAQEALKATFNDHNAISAILTKRFRADNSFGKAVNILVEGVLPFRRTPANILARGLEYSPAQLAKSIAWDIVKLKNGEINAATYIDRLSAGLTGSAAIALGYALASGVFGIRLRGKIEDEDEKRMGHQQYAIEIGDQSYTVDWLAPTNIPLFVGANLYNSLNSQKEDVSWFASALDAVGNSLEPMLELSCLSSLNDIIESAKYAEDGTAVYSLIASAATSYLTQFIPTLFGQVEQATETEKQTAYSSAATPVERSIEKTIGRMTQRIPGLDLFQAQKYDAWGNEVETSSAYQSFINPAYASDITETTVDQEISRLNKAQDENVSPSLPGQTITYTGTDGASHDNQRLTAEEYETMCRVQGQTQKKVVEDLISSADYATLSDVDKAKAIEYAYDYARDTARIEVFDDYPGYSSEWMEKIDSNAAETILRKVATSTTEKHAEIPISTAAYVDDLLKSLKPEEDRTSVRAVQKMEAVVADDKLTDYVDDLLRDIMSDSLEEKYDTALNKGISAEDFVDGYRQYRDTTGAGKKQSLIRYYQRELGLSYAAAQTLYKIYNGTA